MLTLISLLLITLIIAGLFAYKFRAYIYSWFIDFPKPIYQMNMEKNVMIPMHDGVKLATDIYTPKTTKKCPVIIMRTPYDKGGNTHPYNLLALLFVSQGYVFIVQDVRGRYLSEGVYEPYQNEARDGFTIIEWAGKASFSNGNVALYGFSYLGSCAWLAVPFKSPYLKTIVPMFTTQDIYSIFIDKGIFHLKGALYWLTKFIDKAENKNLPFTALKKLFMKLPVNSLDKEALGYSVTTYQEYVKNIVPNEFWANICVSQRMGEINIPALIVTGWFDPYIQGSIDDFLRMNNSRDHSMNKFTRLVIGPWGHNPAQKLVGMSYGRKAEFNLQLVNTLKWCNYWLKGEKDPFYDKEHKISYFLMGKNEWRKANSWPPEEVVYKNYYLSSEKNGSRCVYKLLKEMPHTLSMAKYKYDPNDPVPFRGVYHLNDPGWVGHFDQSELLCRKDMITFMSEPLEKDVIVAGNVKLILYVSTDALDTDFSAKICDVQPGGESNYLQAGILRMRYRESLHMPVLVEPGKIYCIEISLKSIAHVFLKDHRIQIQVASSDFPVHDRNLNTGESSEFSVETKVAEQTIYCGGEFNSHIVLPILPK